MTVQNEQCIYIVSTNDTWKAVVAAILASRFDTQKIIQQQNTENLFQLTSDTIVILDNATFGTNVVNGIPPIQRGGQWLLVNATHIDEANVAEIISKGFSGLITTELTLEMLIRALRTIENKQLWFSRDAMSLALKVLVNSSETGQHSLNQLGDKYLLSCREKQVFFHLLNGSSNKEIANQLHLSLSTVKCHVSSILLKTGKRSRSQINSLLMEPENSSAQSAAVANISFQCA
ncbi:helix-turn-helix transcriptional regulator [Shewanella fidelis]|uniref:helix-turn-helix transcriptional regulator n=1 Tax=Shewanella fidelis TaxID=173509 RepID=UPI0004AD1D24|nr:LuxR C-terminal-related transcriptional regulator [Shewanella fidelis]